MKKIVLLIGLIMIMLNTATLQAETREIEVVLNNVFVHVDNGNLDSDNILYNDTTYLPLRAVGEALALNVNYDSNTKRVDLTDGGNIRVSALDTGQPKEEKSIKAGFNTVEIYINNELVEVDSILYNDKVYIPLRKIAEYMNVEVEYDNHLKAVYLSTKVVEDVLKVGFVTDTSGIDKSYYNQAAWEGIASYEKENENTIEITFIETDGESNEKILRAYADLVDREYDVIFSLGFLFEEAVYKAQSLYPEVKFVILDGEPHNGDRITKINDNTKSIYFKEEELGFYAGVMAALNSKTGNVGFIGGMEIPPVQKFGWGYVAGVAYANRNFGYDYDENIKHNNNARVSKYIYQGTFVDVGGGNEIARSFYDDDVDVIFAAAGGVGIGAIFEARFRRDNDEEAWVIGIDIDMYNEGIVDDGSSVILTSVIKDYLRATYLTIDEIVNGNFQGGTMVSIGSSDYAVGLPKENPNLNESYLNVYNEVYEQVAKGKIIVPTTLEELEIFLDEYGYEEVEGISY